MESKSEFPTFCYNVKNIQMLAPGQGNTVNLAQIGDDNKTIQYITQPFTTSYGQSYTIVNPLQLAAGQNGQIVINKPNTISNISFKCDVCSQIFPHLTLLNQHKRTHNQDDSHSDTVTVVTPSSGQIIQAQNLINESGQSLGQIQIVAAESLEPAQLHQLQGENFSVVQQTTNTKSSEKGKCVSCGGAIAQNAKRKGPKLIRCENCIQNDSSAQSSRPTQIFVSPDGEVKFEVGEMNHNNVIQIHKQIKKKQQPQQQQATVTTVTKCTTCNGSGYMTVSTEPQQQHQTTTTVIPVISPTPTAVVTQQQQQSTKANNSNTTNAAQSIQNSSSPSSQKIQHIRVTQAKASPPASQQQPVIHHAVQHHAPPANQGARAQSESDKPFSCNICGGKFSRYSSLWSHKKLHSGEKNYRCDLCSASFAKAVYLKNHMRIHSGEKPYRCNMCGMTFSQSPHLKNHERTHTGEKPYVCQICDKGFARHATLWNHRRIHTGEKPYKCERCSAAFSQAAHLRNHEKVHLGLKPYKCSICSGSFSDKFALKRHTNIHQKYGQTIPQHADISEDGMMDDEDMKEEDEDEDDSSVKDEMIMGQ